MCDLGISCHNFFILKFQYKMNALLLVLKEYFKVIFSHVYTGVEEARAVIYSLKNKFFCRKSGWYLALNRSW